MLSEFLRLILPSTGKYAFVTIKQNPSGKPVVRHHWYDSIEGLAGASAQGVDCYFACASYTEPKRTQANVREVKALWADLDLKGTQYADLQAALKHTAEFCKAYKLPRPTVVFSGGGWHLYWAFDTAVDADTWLVYANGLHSAANTFGLALDVKRTRDAASILRLPGTSNLKYSSSPLVQVAGKLSAESPLQCFSQLETLGRSTAAKPATTKVKTAAVADKFIARTTDGDADFISANCAQIAHLKETGSESEPHWYACANVLKYCDQGLEKFLEWSSKYAGYNEEQAKAKFAHAIDSNSGPTLCSSFKGIRPDACKACMQPHVVSTPLNAHRLQTNHRPKEASTGTPQSDDGDAEASAEYAEESLHPIPSPFLIDDKVICAPANNGPKRKGDIDVYARVVSGDVRVVEFHSTKSKGYVVFAFKGQRDTTYRQVVLSASELMGNNVAGVLADKDITVYNTALWREYFSACVHEIRKMKDTVKSYDSFGWQDDEENTFILGPWKYSTKGRERATLLPNIEARSKLLGTAPGGSIKGAVAALDRVMQQFSSNQILLYCLGLSAPLVKFTTVEEGGPIGWDYSHESGTGKSTTILAIEAAFGRPKCLRINERDTNNAKAMLFGIMKSLPVTVDDPSIINEEPFKALIDMAVAGTDKNALTQKRELSADPKSWKTVFIGASNFNPIDYILDQRKRRIIGFAEPIKPHLDRSQWQEINAELIKNSGWIAHELMKFWIQPKVQEYISKRIQAYEVAITKEYSFRSEDRFNVTAISLALTTLEFLKKVASDAGTPLVINNKEMLKVGVAAAKDTMSTADANDGGPAYDVVANFVASHAGEMIAKLPPTKSGLAVSYEVPSNMRALTVIHDVEQGVYQIRKSAFTKWAKDVARRSPNEILRQLRGKQLLVADNRTIMMTVPHPDTPRVGMQRCIVVKVLSE